MLDVGCWMLDVGWVDHSCMYFTPIRFGILSRTNQIAACIYGSFSCCFGFKVRPSLFCYRFDLIRLCWPEVSIPVLNFYVALGENIVCGF